MSARAFLSWLCVGAVAGCLMALSGCGSVGYSNPGPIGIQVQPKCQLELLQLHQGFDLNGEPAEWWLAVDVPGQRARLCVVRAGAETCVAVDAETVWSLLLELEDVFVPEEPVEDG